MATTVPEFYNRYLNMWRDAAARLPASADSTRLTAALTAYQSAESNPRSEDAEVLKRGRDLRKELVLMFALYGIERPCVDDIFAVADPEHSWATRPARTKHPDPIVCVAVDVISKFPGVPYLH